MRPIPDDAMKMHAPRARREPLPWGSGCLIPIGPALVLGVALWAVIWAILTGH